MENVTTLTSQKRPFSQHCTTTGYLNYHNYILAGNISPKSLPPGNRGSTQNIRWFLKTHYNHQLKISITAKRSYQIKIIKVFFFWQAGLWLGGDTRGIFLFELKYSVMGFRNTGFN